jgi:hypothetical protein
MQEVEDDGAGILQKFGVAATQEFRELASFALFGVSCLNT